MDNWIFLALLSAAAAAGVGIFGKLGVAQIDSTLATTVRSIIMAIFLVVVSISLGKAKLLSTISPRALMFIVLAGISGALSWLFYFTALQNGPVAGVAALDRLSVVFVVIFSILFLSEKLTVESVLGSILITLGAVFLTGHYKIADLITLGQKLVK